MPTGAPISRSVLLFGTVALAFLLPGVLILLYRRDVRVDPENRQVVERQTYFGFGRTRSYALSSFKKIVLARRLIKRSRSGRSLGNSHARRSYPFFVVELAPAGSKPVRIVTDQMEDPAREAAVKLAALTRLAVDDEVEREAHTRSRRVGRRRRRRLTFSDSATSEPRLSASPFDIEAAVP